MTARAVASLNILLEYSVPLLKIKGLFVAMKSNLENEINNIDHAIKELNIKQDKLVEFKLPFENSKRTLISFIKLNTTNKKYPRRFALIKQKPPHR